MTTFTKLASTLHVPSKSGKAIKREGRKEASVFCSRGSNYHSMHLASYSSSVANWSCN